MADKDKPVTPDWDTGEDDGYHGLGVPFEQDEPYENPNQRGLKAMMSFFALVIIGSIAVFVLLVGLVVWAISVWWN